MFEKGLHDLGIRSEDTATANLNGEIKDGQDAYENEEANGEFRFVFDSCG